MAQVSAPLNNTACMVVGDGGAGKTHSMSTWPLPMDIAAFERGTQCLDNLPAELRDQINVEYFIDDNLERPTALNDFRKWFGGVATRAQKGEIKSFGIDSATTLGDAMMDVVLLENARVGEDPRFEVEYRSFPWRAKKLLKTIVALPCHVVMAAHIKQVDIKDEKGRVTGTKYQPAFIGSAVWPTFVTTFREMYYAYRARQGGKVKHYWLTTMRQETEWCKTTMGGMGILPDVVGQDYSALLAKVAEHRKKGGGARENK